MQPVKLDSFHLVIGMIALAYGALWVILEALTVYILYRLYRFLKQRAG